jgi:hypothetical protein
MCIAHAGTLIDHKTTDDILTVVAGGAEALQQLGMQQEDVRFFAEVCAIQAAGQSAHSSSTEGHPASSLVHSASTLNSTPSASPTEAALPSTRDPCSHSVRNSGRPCIKGRCLGSSGCSTAQPVGLEQSRGGKGAQSHLALADSCKSLGQAVGRVVDFLLHAVLPMQLGTLQTSYAVSALSFISTAVAAQDTQCSAFQAALERLSSGDCQKPANSAGLTSLECPEDSVNRARSVLVSIVLHRASQLPERWKQQRPCYLAAVTGTCVHICSEAHSSGRMLGDCMCGAGLISRARQTEASGSEVAAGFLEELLEMPTTGQTLFRIAAAELERGVAALADAGRCILSSIGAELP